MDTKQIKKLFNIRTIASILSILMILAMAIPANGSAYAQEGLPYLRAFPDQDFVDGSRWPAGEPVSLTIDGSGFGPQVSDGDGYVTFDLAGYDLQRGDTLTMSSGETTVVYTARQLVVDNIDLDAQTVSGTVDGQQTLHVWVGEADENVDTDEDGNWTVYLSGYDNVLYPGACGNAEAWDAWEEQTSDSSTIIDWCVTPWRDEFDGELADGWQWLNGDPDKHEFTTDGFLRIYTSLGETGHENLLLRPVADGDFSIETRLLFTPTSNFQFAGLVVWQDASNFLQLGRAFCDIEGICVGNGIYFDYSLDGKRVDGNFATQIDNPFDPAESYLRIERRGEMVRALYSHEGITWVEIGIHWIPPGFQVNGVGLKSAQDLSDLSIPADFDYFEMTEGWGFLPEGYHDYDQGDVPSWACNAGGWAVDPDNREADIAVEIDVDGDPLQDLLYAGEYREDLDNAGVCVDGYCGFSTSLWGRISTYETHSIVAYAQDIPSGEWVQLYNSPKDLTCRTYDIYAYDPLNGETKQITNRPETDEYSPSWSPNGKKIAYDVLFGDGSQGIYITDLETGASTALAGAEDGGNDAVWSQNGKWIAFDRKYVGDPSVYIVPSTGGNRILVRENALEPDWAPNGKRLVFQDFVQGGIHTIPVDGGKGVETTIAENGANPAWSPDGNWIAYEYEGDIWKVNVNVQGSTFGEPIQLTSGPFNDGQPTWSPDSQTIVYHSGLNDDWDLWSVPAAGGTSTWLTGAVVFGDYDPSYAKNSPTVGYASFSPNGQAERTWAAAFTYDAGTWDKGTHTYQFWTQGYTIGDEFSFVVLGDAQYYDGYTLIRPRSWLVAQTPDGCADIDAINPGQETRFFIGWSFDGSYAEAPSYYEDLLVQVRWDSWVPVDMVMHDIIPYTASVDWQGYSCTFIAP
jgi:Tol biopolymer transport system component